MFLRRVGLHLRWLPLPNQVCHVDLKGQNMILFIFFSGPFFFFTPCFDPLERRGIPVLVGVATGDGVQLVLKR